MEKHVVYIVAGLALAMFGPQLAPVLPFLDGLHGAGLGVAIAGLIDWFHLKRGS